MGKELRILILEDIPADTESEEHELRKAGLVFTSKIVYTREALLKALEDFLPDIVLSGYELASLDGFAALAIVNENCPDVPFILVTGALGEEFAIEAIKKGVTDYVLKSNLKRLVPVINRALEEAKLIKERKQAEKVLRESEERFRQIAESAGVWIWEVDVNGLYTYSNPIVEKLLGYKPEEIVGEKHFYDLFAPEIREELKKAAFWVFKSKQIFSNFVNANIHKSGHIVIMETSGTPILNEIGNLIGYRGSDTDITERKQAVERLHHSEAMLSNAMKIATLGHWEYDVAKDIFTFNDNFYAIFRTTAEQVGGYTMSSADYAKRFLHPGDQEIVGVEIRKAIEADDPKFNRQLEHRIIYADGEIGYITVRFFIVKDERGRTIKTYGVNQDITERKRAEDDLRKSEVLRAIVDTTPFPIAVVDLYDNGITFWSQSALTLFGHVASTTPEWFKIAYPDPDYRREVVERWGSMLEKARLSGKVNNIGEYRVSCRDGSLHICELYASYLAEKLIVTFNDITERKKTEEALRLEKDFSETLLESLPGLFYLYELDSQSPANSRLIRFNMKHSTLTGYTPAELMGMTLKDWFEPDERKKVVRVLRIIGKRGEAQANFKLRMKDGSQVPYAFTAQMLKIGDKMYFLGMGIDISDLVNTEQALKESEEKYRLVVEKAHDAILILQDGKIKFHNYQSIALSGYSAEEITITPFSSFIHDDDRDMVMDMHRKRLLGENIPSTYSFRFINKSGETIWVEVTGILIAWEGRPAALVFLKDITIQKELEKQLLQSQKMEAIGILAGGVAHNFNNLLMTILGYTSLMLMKTEKTHPFYEKLKIIEKEVENGADLTKQLLGFARGGKYQPKPINVNNLIIKTLDIFGRTKKEITIHKKLQQDLHPIEADTGQIEQVCLNLYVNAWQAMPSGGSLYLETQNVILNKQQCCAYNIEPGAYIKISVTDTGVGMDSVTQKRIFEPFFTTKGVGKGTGLGLSSAYGIIRNHGGNIDVYSDKGHGTTFTIYLPASGKEVTETKPAEGSLITGQETILIVDDEQKVLLSVKALLEKLGYKIVAAQSGKEAIELYKKHSKDIKLVILDMIMPEMNGRETLVKLMEIDKDVCVLLSSGYSIDGEAKTILDLGCKGFIQKPFRIEDLSRKIRDVLDSRAS